MNTIKHLEYTYNGRRAINLAPALAVRQGQAGLQGGRMRLL